MNIHDAHDICRPLDERTFQDQTLDLADELTGAVNREHARQEAQAAIAPKYRNAACELERIAINLKAYARGMVGKQVVPSYIKQAREALEAMESAL